MSFHVLCPRSDILTVGAKVVIVDVFIVTKDLINVVDSVADNVDRGPTMVEEMAEAFEAFLR